MYDHAFKQRYIDSYSFLPMKLSKMTSALNLNTEEKGFFPHHFNHLQNADYVGPYPSKEHYGYHTMSDHDREKFDRCCESVAGQMFDLKKTTCNVLYEQCCFVVGGLHKIQKGAYRVYKRGSIRLCNDCGMCYEGV